AIREFLAGILSTPGEGSLLVSGGIYDRDASISKVIDAAADKVGASFAGQPQDEASVRMILSGAYWHAGRYEACEREAQRAYVIRRERLGERDLRTLAALQRAAEALREQGKLAEAASRFRQLRDEYERQLGSTDPRLLAVRGNVVLMLAEQPEQFRDSQEFVNTTIQIQREVMGPEALLTRQTQAAYAKALLSLGKLKEAEQIAKQTMHGNWPQSHRSLWDCFVTLGGVAEQRGELEKAEQIYKEALNRQSQFGGDEHPFTYELRYALSRVLIFQGRYAEAEVLSKKNVELMQREWGDSNAKKLSWNLGNLAWALQRQQKIAEATLVHRQRVELTQRALGKDHVETLQARNSLAWCLWEDGQANEAKPIAQSAVDGFRRVQQQPSLVMLNALDTLAVILRDTGDLEQAEGLFQEMTILWQQLHEDGTPFNPEPQLHYGECLLKMKRYDQAEPMLLASYRAFQKSVGEKDPDTQSALSRLVELYEAMGRNDRAEEYRALQAAAKSGNGPR
ncbi:MAG: tetratricopeptide repeat protein, partial [Planctomycetota bacterium]